MTPEKVAEINAVANQIGMAGNTRVCHLLYGLLAENAKLWVVVKAARLAHRVLGAEPFNDGGHDAAWCALNDALADLDKEAVK